MASSRKPTINVGSIEVDFLVEAEDSGGSVTVFECRVPAQAQVPAPHSHDAFEETIYGLRGSCTWTVDGEAIEVGPGDSLCLRRGQIHGFANQSTDDAAFLAIASPGVFGADYFRDINSVLAGSGPPDLEAIGRVMRRHGLTPARPAAAPPPAVAQ